MSNIFLVGMTGCGKSTLGKHLAKELNYSFVDSDIWIEITTGKKIPTIFERDGEPHFRKLEAEFIDFTKSLKNKVIATGAGLPCTNDLMLPMNEIGTTIWLDVDENILVERLSNDSTSRPKLLEFSSIEEAIHSMLEDRRKFYEQAKLRIKNPTEGTLLQLVKDIV